MKIMDKLEEWLAGTLLLVVFLIIIAQILANQPFRAPFIWSETLAQLLFVYIGLLGISMAIRSQQHVYIDFVTNFMSPSIKKLANSFVQLLIFISIIFFIYLGYIDWENATSPMDALKATFNVKITEKWLFAGLPIIAPLMLFRFCQAQAENFKNNLSYLPVAFFVVSAVIIFAILYIQPEWFKALRISSYVKFGKNAVYITLVVWLVIMFLGTPVGWSLFIATLLYFSMTHWEVANSASEKLINSLNSFPLLSVPFFIFYWYSDEYGRNHGTDL